MNLTPTDKALAAGFAGQLEAPQKRDYVVTVIRDSHRHQWTEGYASQQAAQDAGMDFLGTFHGVVCVRPLIELTEAEGARRFPHPLHKDAFTDAWRGWHERAEAHPADPLPSWWAPAQHPRLHRRQPWVAGLRPP